MPDNDCMLAAQGLVIISGHVRFIVGKKNRDFDCCRDGESHGSILCSWSNLTIAEGAVVTVETSDPDVIINPGGFWTSDYITVNGTVNATLLTVGQMTGVNGLFSSSGVLVGRSGQVIVRGPNIARGAAIQGGDAGTVIEGSVSCDSFVASDAGGCVAGGKFLRIAASASIRCTNATDNDNPQAGVAGMVLSAGDMNSLGGFEGHLFADTLNTTDAGAIIAADNVVMSGDAVIEGYNLYAGASGAAISTGNLTMRDNARIVTNNTWGGDGGAIAANFMTMRGNSSISCSNGYADNCGGCILSSMDFGDNASVYARNMHGKMLGGALCGGYPHQAMILSGTASVDLQDSRAKLYGGAVLAHNISVMGSASLRIRNAQASCGGGVLAIGDEDNRVGDGVVLVDSKSTATITIEDAHELNATFGCLTIEANLVDVAGGGGGGGGSIVPQPCSGCADPTFNASKRAACTCGRQNPDSTTTLTECCHFSL